MLRVDGWVVYEWRERYADLGADLVLPMLFRPDERDHARVLRELEAAFLEAAEAYYARPGNQDEDALRFGSWSCEPSADGIRIDLHNPEVLDRELPAIVAALERRGLGGELVFVDDAEGRLPSIAPVLGCRLVTNGTPGHDYMGSFRLPDRFSLHPVIDAATDWAGFRGDTSAYCLGLDQFRRWAPVDQGTSTAEAIELALPRTRRVVGHCGRAFRGVAQLSASGRLGLVAGRSDDPPSDWWQPALEDLIGFVRAHAEHLVYAHIARGWDVAGALALGILPSDWPARPEYQSDEHDWHRRSAFDDVLAPDAFGTMLLGPGFADRLPDASDWHLEPVGTDRWLLRHRDPDAWYAEPPNAHTRSAHLERARETLAPLLFTPADARRPRPRPTDES
jgi:hypothetical protein